MKKCGLFLMIFLLLVLSNLYSQNEGIQIGIIGDKFSDFTLKTYQGNQITTSELRGKNILLISSRGK
jgi:hypothetical protein